VQIKDRIVELKRIKGKDLLPHPLNPRVLPARQREVLASVLEDLGMADRLLAYYSERNGGGLTLIDGHERSRDFADLEWPVLITDLNDQEADALLATLDPIAALAIIDERMQQDLLASLDTDALPPPWADLLTSLDEHHDDQSGADLSQSSAENPVPEMELLPYEHYDYLMVMFRDIMDFGYAIDRLGLEKRAYSTDLVAKENRGRRIRRIGLCRVISWEELKQKCGL